MFQIQKLSNYGTSQPAIARTALQARDILGVSSAPDEQKQQCLEILHELSRHLIRCVEIRDRVASEVQEGRTQVERGAISVQGSAIHLPGVADLQTQAESFLQSAKLAIRQAGISTRPFFGIDKGHNISALAKWAKQQYGPNDAFTKMLVAWSPWVSLRIDMRNAVDHPKDAPRGKLIVSDFRVNYTEKGFEIGEPVWGLDENELFPIVQDMNMTIEGIIRLSEDMVFGIVEKTPLPFAPIYFVEIPEDKRDPSCPKRFTFGLPPGMEPA